jgi:hypothetical protein
MAKSTPRRQALEQHKCFIETARTLGCDEDKNRFEEALGKIAAYKPPGRLSKKLAKQATAKVK